MFIAKATAVTDELVDTFARLLPQLKLSFPPPLQADMVVILM